MIIAAGDVQTHHIIQTQSIYENTWHVKDYAHLKVIFEVRGTLTSITCILEENAQLELIPLIIENDVSELHIRLELAQSAYAVIKGAYALYAAQKSIIRVHQHHQGKASISHVTINGVAAGASQLDYSGMICIQEDASKSHASQENKTILWSDTAKAQSIPSLEVKTNDVQCAHGSAIGYLNKEHIWYAQSRGMSTLQAQELLLKSFFCQTLPDSIDDKIIKKLVQKIIE